MYKLSCLYAVLPYPIPHPHPPPPPPLHPQAAFPSPTKRIEALAFTWQPLLLHLDQLLATTPQSLAADRSIALEEAKQMHEEQVRGVRGRGHGAVGMGQREG